MGALLWEYVNERTLAQTPSVSMSDNGAEMQFTVACPTHIHRERPLPRHHDINWTADENSGRKLAITVQLLMPSRLLKAARSSSTNGEPMNYDKEIRGTVLVFPTATCHVRLPVTSGTRKSLVAWFHRIAPPMESGMDTASKLAHERVLPPIRYACSRTSRNGYIDKRLWHCREPNRWHHRKPSSQQASARRAKCRQLETALIVTMGTQTISVEHWSSIELPLVRRATKQAAPPHLPPTPQTQREHPREVHPCPELTLRESKESDH